MWTNFKTRIKKFLQRRKSQKKGIESIISLKLTGAHLVGDPLLLKIGENVSFGGDVLLYANSSIEIGDNTIIAYHVIIHTSTHDYNNHPIWTKRIDRPIKIGKHVWIGTGVIILPGVIIGDYSVIGAGSLVNTNIPEGVIAGGNPIKIIKKREEGCYKRSQEIESFDASVIEKGAYLEIECKIK
jgi:acetyltransferase-like isoleucine patch superfamily enzyme